MGSGEFTPQAPQFVQNVRDGCSTESVSEAVNIAAAGYVKDAAGSTVVFDLTRGPILEMSGGRIGSFWGSPHNLQYKATVQAVVETNGAAAFNVYDSGKDLEKIFESSTKGRYIAKLTDGASHELYGWIGGVAVASDVYTFSIYSGVGLGTQNWFQGGSTAFSHASYGSKVEIYKYATSLTFGSSDTFTEEVPFHAPDDPRSAGETEFRFLAGLTNGQYGIDYKNQRFMGRKANTDDTETLTYTTFAGADDLQDVNIRSVSTAALTNVGDEIVSTQLVAANTSRKGLYIRNDSTSPMNIAFGSAASATNFTLRLAAQGYYEMPLPIYTGALYGIWDLDGGGAARITQLTA